MNVIDMRTTLRRSPMNMEAARRIQDDRRKGDRRVLKTEKAGKDAIPHRIWLTPGERALIEDLYLLED